MLLDFLFQIWKRLGAHLQWWFLWLFNSKFMVSVSGVVLDGEGRIFLQRHRHWVHDVWGLPGGIVQSGEKLEDAFAREVFEETGLFVSKIELVKVVSGYRMRLEVYFKSRLDPEKGMQAVNIQEQEILEARFFPLDDLPEKMLPAQKEIIRIVRL
ncbi:MAG TPA: NUDIX domain-containing protein [Anaerolineales bacterium]|nr:NUDIX domain-containing protein [Anaerolineales bacterium]